MTSLIKKTQSLEYGELFWEMNSAKHIQLQATPDIFLGKNTEVTLQFFSWGWMAFGLEKKKKAIASYVSFKSLR